MDKYVIAFIDLLGSRKKILNDNNGSYFNQVRGLYNDIILMLNEMDAPNIKSKIFSDNIVFARKITNSNEVKIANLHQMISIAAMFQLYSIIKGNCMVKGGIVFGEFYIDDIMVWSKGLVEAYELESHIEHTSPTIHIDGEAKELILNNREKFPVVSGDDRIFVDYLQMTELDVEDMTVLELHRFAVLKYSMKSIKNFYKKELMSVNQ